jgi:antitoxin component YwqK of YwqJK toxin-antitoxin module
MYLVIFIILAISTVFSEDKSLVENGFNITYHPSGNIKSTFVLNNSKPVGVVIELDDNQKIIRQESYNATGERDGQFIWWNNNGTINMVVTWKQDKRNGLTRIFTEEGRPIREMNYVDGKLEKTKYFEPFKSKN